MSLKRLTVKYQGNVLAVLDLPPGSYTIGAWKEGQGGAEPSVPVAGHGSFISKQHCHLIVDGSSIEIVDGWPDGLARSTSGVYVNGVRADRVEVEEGSRISLGNPADPARHLDVELSVATNGTRDAHPGPVDMSPSPSGERDPDSKEISDKFLQMEQRLGTTWGNQPGAPEAETPSSRMRRLSEPAFPAPDPAEAPAVVPPDADQGPLASDTHQAASDATEIATREAVLDVIRGITREQAEAAGLPDDRAGYRGKQFNLHQHQQEAIIGRDHGCDLVIEDPDQSVNRRISRQHARIEYRPEEGIFRIYNRSGNGVIVRRLPHPVMDDAILNDGDVIVIGNTAIRIRIRDLGEGVKPRARTGLVAALAVAGIATIAGLAGWGWETLTAPRAQNAAPSAQVMWSRTVASESGSSVRVAASVTAKRTDVVAATDRGEIQLLGGADGTPVATQFPSFSGLSASAPLLHDLDGDGVPDVVLAVSDPGLRKGRIVALSGATGQLLWEATPGCNDPACAYRSEPAIADVGGDGTGWIFVAGSAARGGFACALNSRTGHELWKADCGGAETVFHLPVVFVRGATPEASAVVATSDDGTLYVLSAKEGTPLRSIECRSRALSPPAVTDLDGNGKKQLAILNDAYQLQVFDLSTGAEVGPPFTMETDFYSLPPGLASRRATAPVAADLNGDGADEIVVANPGRTEGSNAIVALAGKALRELWRLPLGNTRTVLAPPALADVTGDGLPDVIAVVSNLQSKKVELLVISGLTGKQLASLPPLDAAGGNTAPVVADLGGRKQLATVVGLEGGLVVAASLGVPALGQRAPWAAARGDGTNSGHLSRVNLASKRDLSLLWFGLIGVGLAGILSVGLVYRRNRWAFRQ